MPIRIHLAIGIGLTTVVLILLATGLIEKPRWLLPQLRAGDDLAMPGDRPEAIVEFQIVEMKASQRDGRTKMRVWDATYPSASGAAHFEIAMELREPTPDAQFPLTRGVLTARDDSHADGLLSALARAHHSWRSSRTVGESSKPKVREVPFEAANFGTALTRGPGSLILAGEFTSDRPGPWILVKMFLPAEGADIFVALNPSDGKGLFISRYDENWQDLEPFLESVL